MNYKIIIPTRMSSTRLPGKPLKLINGKSMIWHVYQRALETNIGRDNIIIATDSEQIFNAASDFGAQVMMTSSDHQSGTERCAEVVIKLGWDDDVVVVNLQGDEPLLPAKVIELTALTLSDSALAGMATIGCPIASQADLLDPNCVKLLTDSNSKAMVFSRLPMHFGVDGFDFNGTDVDSSAKQCEPGNGSLGPWLRHIGVYAYRVWTLKSLRVLPQTKIEQYERLEQLKAMWYGIHIQVACIDKAPKHGVDTQEDLDRVRNLVNARVA